MIQFDEKDLAMMWLSLVMEQKAHSKGSLIWFRFENLIRRIESQLGMKHRPRLRSVAND